MHRWIVEHQAVDRERKRRSTAMRIAAVVLHAKLHDTPAIVSGHINLDLVRLGIQFA